MQPTNPRVAVELLEVFRIGITNKVLDRQRVIDWADAIIEQDAAPDYFVIELAMCGSWNSNDLISLLSEYIGEPKPRMAGRAALSFLHQEYMAGRIDLYRVVRTIDWLVLNHDFTEVEQDLMNGVYDEYAMAVEGVYGTVAAITDYVLHFLTCYQGFRLENMAEWSEIDALIPGKVKALYNQSKTS